MSVGFFKGLNSHNWSRSLISIAFTVACSFAAFLCLTNGTKTVDASVIRDQSIRPPMFVLQVGIGTYLNGPKWSDLRGTATDVDEMRKLLEGERFQVPAANILTLKDKDGTKSKIFAGFAQHLIKNAKDHFDRAKRRDAVVLFQYSGHGSQALDADGDEKDKLDETLVTYDSQDIKGKNFDITDDEIYALTSELKRYTDNIVYIFDSCHSGSGTRNSEDARRLPARTTIPEPMSLPGSVTRSGRNEVDGSDSSIMPPGSDYIVISASQADQIATQRYCFEECGSSTEPIVYGLLTYYLIEELRNARRDTSYRDVMENVVRKVNAEKPTQTPLLEGDDRRPVFGSLGRTDDNFVRIINANAGTVRIRSGAIQGVSAGTIVSFYSSDVTRTDDAEKLTVGRVVSVTPTQSIVAISSPTRAITSSDKAIVVSSDLASARSKVLVDGIGGSWPSDLQAIAARIRSSFADKGGFADPRPVAILAPSALNRQTGRWHVALLKDKYTKVFPDSRPRCYESGATSTLGENREIYYLAGQDFVPLFGFCVEAASDEATTVEAAAAQIESALTHIAKYRSAQSVQNRRSRLANKVVVRPIRLISNSGAFKGQTHCIDGKFVADKLEVAAKSPTGKYRFGTREAFWFEVVNNSGFDVYVSVLNFRSDGSVRALFPRNIEGETDGVVVPKGGGRRIVRGDDCRVNASGDFVEAGAMRTAAETGTDAFKFIIASSRLSWADLSFFELDKLERNEIPSLATNNEWIAIDLAFEIK